MVRTPQWRATAATATPLPIVLPGMKTVEDRPWGGSGEVLEVGRDHCVVLTADGSLLAKRLADVELRGGRSPGADPPEPTPGRDWTASLIDEASAIRDAIKKAGNESRHPYQMLCDATEPDDPDPEDLTFALEHFHSLSAAERRDLTGGWSLDRQPTHEEARLLWGASGAQRFLCLKIGTDAGWPPRASFEMVPEDGRSPVMLLIRPGTLRAEALALLEELHTIIEGRWAELITDPVGTDLRVVEAVEQEGRAEA